MGSSPEKTQGNITISVDPGALGHGLPSGNWLASLGEELIRKYFPSDLAQSLRVSGRISMSKRSDDAVLYELKILFLYSKTYTAVNHRILFAVTGENYTIISVE